MRFAVGIPHTRDFSGRALDSLMGLERPEDGFHLIRVPNLPVDEARNEVVRKFLAHPEAEYLLFIDSDMVFHPHSLARLASRLDRMGNRLGQQVDMVAALTFTRCLPPVPTVFRGVAGVENDRSAILLCRSGRAACHKRSDKQRLCKVTSERRQSSILLCSCSAFHFLRAFATSAARSYSLRDRSCQPEVWYQ